MKGCAKEGLPNGGGRVDGRGSGGNLTRCSGRDVTLTVGEEEVILFLDNGQRWNCDERVTDVAEGSGIWRLMVNWKAED